MSEVIEINAKTGERVERDFTPQELAQREAEAAEVKAKEKEKAAADKATAKATADAIAHAKSLGFTEAMIAVMYPNLGA
jgi:hypothetical protein